MEDKIKRFIELSREFTVNRQEIYGEDNTWYGTTSCGVSGTIRLAYDSDQPTLTSELEKFIRNQDKKVKKAERFEEYLTLQTDLSNYYNALTKLK